MNLPKQPYKLHEKYSKYKKYFLNHYRLFQITIDYYTIPTEYIKILRKNL